MGTTTDQETCRTASVSLNHKVQIIIIITTCIYGLSFTSMTLHPMTLLGQQASLVRAKEIIIRTRNGTVDLLAVSRRQKKLPPFAYG